MLKKYILSLIIFFPLHNMATVQRGGDIAFGGELLFCLLWPLLWEYGKNSVKELLNDSSM